ncbi:ceramide phosphoethanolamine synthase [Aphidius gifuensis]|uniref:ceramide phosphoethanolamine synthase n=1 Tax=Aphidius gifuensis TaxID=684658 RepID=UPI001CDB6760|nr:ceramide phosphoethanolamine synthase [Aphidius gifuensis]
MGLHVSEKRYIIGFFIIYICFCFVMDVKLHYRVINYSIRPDNGIKYESSVPCDLNPFCVVTAKGLMLDYINFYIFGPLAALADRTIGFSKCLWLSPNAISFSHVIVATLAGHLVSNKSLTQRRIGVILFQIRTWMDDLDGLVARKRKNISGERSDVGSSGYFIDAICDGLGTTALLIGIFCYLKSYSPRQRGYEKLQPMIPLVNTNQIGSCVVQKKKIRFNNVLPTVLLITGTLIGSSIAWNRYIDLYQVLLETDNVDKLISKNELFTRQTQVFRSNSFWVITTAWKLINPHALTDYILASIFFDRLWEYLHAARWISYIIIVVLVYFTDFQYFQSDAYIKNVPDQLVSEIFMNSTGS